MANAIAHRDGGEWRTIFISYQAHCNFSQASVISQISVISHNMPEIFQFTNVDSSLWLRTLSTMNKVGFGKYHSLDPPSLYHLYQWKCTFIVQCIMVLSAELTNKSYQFGITVLIVCTIHSTLYIVTVDKWIELTCSWSCKQILITAPNIIQSWIFGAFGEDNTNRKQLENGQLFSSGQYVAWLYRQYPG